MEPSVTGDSAGAAPAEDTGAGTSGDATAAADAPDTGADEIAGAEGAAETVDPNAETPAAEGESTEEPAAAAAEAEKPAEEPKAEEPKPARRPDLTARLATLSREKRTLERQAREQAAARAAIEQQFSPIVALIQRVRAGDPKAIREFHELGGVDFQKVVNVYAEQPEPELTPEQKAQSEIEAVRREIETFKESQRKAEAAAAEAAATQQRVATVATIQQTIAKQAEKFELCARNSTEAAEDVFKEILAAWTNAGQPELMPGEFEEAIEAAADVIEKRYEDRGKRFSKTAKVAGTPAATNGTANGKPNGAAKIPPKASTEAALSDTDSEILAGLLAKSAHEVPRPARAKPRTINSALGGSAPPRPRVNGGQDPRAALRDVLSTIR